MKNSSHGGDHEIIKAAAQAWHNHQTAARPATSEFEARRLNFKARATRFAAEAMRKASNINKEYNYENSVIISRSSDSGSSSSSNRWDFGQSLWDYYEIVSVAKKLEVGLVDQPFTASSDEPIRIVGKNNKMHKESKNSLRSLFYKMSSKRFSRDDVPPD